MDGEIGADSPEERLRDPPLVECEDKKRILPRGTDIDVPAVELHERCHGVALFTDEFRDRNKPCSFFRLAGSPAHQKVMAVPDA